MEMITSNLVYRDNISDNRLMEICYIVSDYVTNPTRKTTGFVRWIRSLRRNELSYVKELLIRFRAYGSTKLNYMVDDNTNVCQEPEKRKPGRPKKQIQQSA